VRNVYRYRLSVSRIGSVSLGVHSQVVQANGPKGVALAVIPMCSGPTRVRKLDLCASVRSLVQIENNRCSDGITWAFNAFPLQTLRSVEFSHLPAENWITHRLKSQSVTDLGAAIDLGAVPASKPLERADSIEDFLLRSTDLNFVLNINHGVYRTRFPGRVVVDISHDYSFLRW
jgi:hypothetical protein